MCCLAADGAGNFCNTLKGQLPAIQEFLSCEEVGIYLQQRLALAIDQVMLNTELLVSFVHSARRRSLRFSDGEGVVGCLQNLLALLNRLLGVSLIHVPIELLSNCVAFSFCSDQLSLKLLKSYHGHRAMFFLLAQFLRSGEELGTELL